MPCRSISSGCRHESSQKLYSTGWTNGPKKSTGALDVLCSRKHVLVEFNFSSAPVEPTLQNQSTGAIDVLYSREHVLMDFNFSLAPVEPTLQKQSTGALDVPCSSTLVWSWSVNLFSTGWTHAPTEHAPVQWRKRGYYVRTPTATIWTQRDRLNRRLKSVNHRFFRCSRFFCSGLPTAM